MYQNFQCSLPMPFFSARTGIENLVAHWGFRNPSAPCSKDFTLAPDIGKCIVPVMPLNSHLTADRPENVFRESGRPDERLARLAQGCNISMQYLGLLWRSQRRSGARGGLANFRSSRYESPLPILASSRAANRARYEGPLSCQQNLPR